MLISYQAAIFQEAAKKKKNVFCFVRFYFLKEIGEFPDSKKYAYIPNHAENSWKGWLLNQLVVLFSEAFRKMNYYS